MVGAVIAMMRGREDIVMFRYRLAQERVLKALTIALLALLLVLTVSMILSTTEEGTSWRFYSKRRPPSVRWVSPWA